MKKQTRKEQKSAAPISNRVPSHDYEDSVENGKRRRALPPVSRALDSGSRLFFESVLSVRSIQEFLFITKADLKTR